MREGETRSHVPCVLVGSTDSDTLIMLQSLLREYLLVDTFPCDNPSELARQVAENNPSVAVLDIAPQHLAVCVELIGEMKHSRPAISVVAITSSTEMCGTTMKDAGADECVEKPFEIDALLDAVKRHL